MFNGMALALSRGITLRFPSLKPLGGSIMHTLSLAGGGDSPAGAA
jgi:hypothetical protein